MLEPGGGAGSRVEFAGSEVSTRVTNESQKGQSSMGPALESIEEEFGQLDSPVRGKADRLDAGPLYTILCDVTRSVSYAHEALD